MSIPEISSSFALLCSYCLFQAMFFILSFFHISFMLFQISIEFVIFMVHRLQERERENLNKQFYLKKGEKTYQESLNNYMLSVKILPLNQGVKPLRYISRDYNFEKCLGSGQSSTNFFFFKDEDLLNFQICLGNPL